MKLKINYYGLEPRRFIAGTVGSYGFEEMDLTFSAEWKTLSKKVVFYPAGGGTPVQVVYTGKPFLIPAEAYSARGICRFAVVGYLDEKVLITATGEMDILEALPAEASEAVTPTPSEVAQINNIMQTTLSKMQTFEERAANGDFDGATPTIGENGNWRIRGKDTGVYAVAHRLADGETNSSTLWSSERVTRYGNTHYAGSLTGKVSGKTFSVSDALVRPHGEASVSVFGETTASGTPSSTSPVTLTPLDTAHVTLIGRNLLNPQNLEAGTVNALTGEESVDPTRTRTVLTALTPGVTYYFGVHVPAKLHFYAADGSWLKSATPCAVFTFPTNATYYRAVWVNTLQALTVDPPVLSMTPDVSGIAYRKTEVTLPLRTLHGLPGLQDEILSMPDEGLAGVIRRTYVLTLTGTENWSGSAGHYTLASAVPAAPRSGFGGLCTHFPYQVNAAKNASGSECAIGVDGTALFVYLPDRAGETVTAFKNWLALQNNSGTPVTVVCANHEDEGEYITEPNLFRITPFESSMTLTSDVPLTMTYQKDPQLVIAKLTERVTALESAETSV